MKRFFIVLKMAVIAFLFVACEDEVNDNDDGVTTTDPIDRTTFVSNLDYNDLSNWAFHPDQNFNLLENYNLDVAKIDSNNLLESVITIPNNAATDTGVDIFWVHPTLLETVDATAFNVPLDDQSTLRIAATIIAQGGLLAQYGRFYAPRYQQSTAAAYSPIETEENRSNTIMNSYADIKTAFLNYLDNHNNGNRIIIAGHSQGSFLLSMLLREVFDNYPELLSRLVVAGLGGMNFVYAPTGTYVGGQFENIPLCTSPGETGCILNWTTFKENQPYPSINQALPSFSTILKEEGLLFNTIDTSSQWFVQDEQYYDTTLRPLRNYITPSGNYNYPVSQNFLAFDNYFNIQQVRDGNNGIGFHVGVAASFNDLRPNDLVAQESDPSFARLGYHDKDYNIYLWALLSQIEDKL